MDSPERDPNTSDISRLKRAIRTFQAFRSSPRADSMAKWGQRIITALILGIVTYQLFEIGWAEVFRNLPDQPLFYLLFLFLFVSLPIAEVLIYRQLWTFRALEAFKVFILKRFYNEEFVGYSGEFYLFTWARKATGLGEKQILKDIRDSSILSAITSNSVALFLIAILLGSGIVDPGPWLERVDLFYLAAMGLVLFLAGVLLYTFRNYLFSLPVKKAASIFTIYMGRFLIHNALMILQWMVVLPLIPLSTWLVYVTVDIVIKRIPFLPGKELAFVWAGIELSKVLNVATAEVAGMLLVQSVLNKLVHVFLFLLFQARGKGNDKGRG